MSGACPYSSLCQEAGGSRATDTVQRLYVVHEPAERTPLRFSPGAQLGGHAGGSEDGGARMTAVELLQHQREPSQPSGLAAGRRRARKFFVVDRDSAKKGMLGKKTGEDRNDQFVQHDTLWERGRSTHRLIVQVDSEAPQCTCQYQTAWGVPCRHLLAWQMFTCKTDEQACSRLVHSNSWVSRHWHKKTREDVEKSMASQASAAVLRVTEACKTLDSAEQMDRASLVDIGRKCGDLAWDAGPRYSQEWASCIDRFVKNVLQQGSLTRGNPVAGVPEVADPVRGSAGSVQRKRRASSRPAGSRADGKKVRGVTEEKKECKACGERITKRNFARHLKTCKSRTAS